MQMFLRLSRWAGTAAAGLAMVLAALWAALALWFRIALPSPWRECLVGALLLLAVTAIVGLVLRRWSAVAIYGAVLAVIVGWWGMQTLSNDLLWAPDVARTAVGTIEGNRLVVENVRNFIRRSDTDFDARWEQRNYDLGGLTGVDLIMSYWAGEAIAHTILSFDFADGQHLAFSIEIRKEANEAYSALAGFFRAYELAFVAADERDVVGVRTSVRGEDVRLYRLRLSPAQARALLLEYIAEANELSSDRVSTIR
jgi:uncharacterized protein DUF4105